MPGKQQHKGYARVKPATCHFTDTPVELEEFNLLMQLFIVFKYGRSAFVPFSIEPGAKMCLTETLGKKMLPK